MTTHTIANLLSPETDNRVFFRRPDNTIYAIIGPAGINVLRKRHHLEIYLQQQRDSGVVIKIARA